MVVSSIDPSTGKTMQTFDETTDAEVEAKLELAVRAFQIHKRQSFAERAKHMQSAAEILERDKRMYAQMMTEENRPSSSRTTARSASAAAFGRATGPSASAS